MKMTLLFTKLSFNWTIISRIAVCFIYLFQKYKLGNVKFTKDQQKRLFQRDFQREEHNADVYLKKRCKKGFKINKLKGFIKDLTVDLFREGMQTYRIEFLSINLLSNIIGDS